MRTRFPVAGLAALCLCAGGMAFAQTPTVAPPASPTAAPPAAAQAPRQVTSGEYNGPKIISDAIIAQKAEGLKTQSTDPKWKREATIPEDWNYKLAPGVTTKQVSFYVDGGTRLQGKVFYPKGFDPKASYPGIVVAHGINALAVGIR